MSVTATVITVTVNERNIEGKKKRNRCTVTLTSADTYPASGIALPTHGQFGMVRQLDYIMLLEQVPTLSSDNYVWTWSATAGAGQGSIQGYGTTTAGTAPAVLQELTSGETVDAETKWLIEAVGW
jgi:hypothetical protein